MRKPQYSDNHLSAALRFAYHTSWRVHGIIRSITISIGKKFVKPTNIICGLGIVVSALFKLFFLIRERI
jgi:hypothetical protein